MGWGLIRAVVGVRRVGVGGLGFGVRVVVGWSWGQRYGIGLW